MCDSDDYDMCNDGCMEFTCEDNPSFKNDPPHHNLKKLFGHDRCIVGIRRDDGITIHPVVWSYRQAKMIKHLLKVLNNADVVILNEMS